MEKMENFSLLAGRAFLVAIFLRSGIQKILGFSGTASVIASKGIPVPEFFLIFAILFELIGTISILVGYKSRWGALLLMIFLIPTTLIFHLDFSDQSQVIAFMKNLSILGGLLIIFSQGSGPLSWDSRESK
ncbi:MAG: DoxX family protein [Roseofilum sp. Belize BBD 4]|nr:DoxX family protein [Roseofilum sp. Belize Diploria]MBP0032618.1 DoxX family protein [Roseofilum sp. Belize BBD 4]